jgi:hypothetical protein
MNRLPARSFVVTYCKQYWQRMLWTLGLLLVLSSLSWLGWRVAARDARLTAERNNLSIALNPDGTLQAGASGSFDVHSYRMEQTANGAPRFVPAGAAQADCPGWDSQFDAGVNGYVFAMVAAGDNLYLGGDFTVAGGMAANRVARYNLATNTWSTLGSGRGNGVDRQIYTLAMIGNDLYVGGDFTQANVGGAAVNVLKLAKYNTVTNTWSPIGGNGGVSSDVYAMTVHNSDLFVGGSFIEAYANNSAVRVNRVARYNTTTSTWSALGWGSGCGVNGNVLSLAVVGSDLYLGGSFDQVNWGGAHWATQNYVSKYNLTTNTFSALGSGGGNGVNRQVIAMLAVGTDLYLGGDFFQANVGQGTTVFPNRVAKYNTTTNTFSALGTGDTGVNGPVYALAMRDSNLYVGGNFQKVNSSSGKSQTGFVAEYNTTTGVWTKPGGDIEINFNVQTLLAGVNHLYLGGNSTLISGGSHTIAYAGRVCYNTSPTINGLAVTRK